MNNAFFLYNYFIHKNLFYVGIINSFKTQISKVDIIQRYQQDIFKPFQVCLTSNNNLNGKNQGLDVISKDTFIYCFDISMSSQLFT